MPQVADHTNLQSSSIQDIESAYPLMQGWATASDLNPVGVVTTPGAKLVAKDAEDVTSRSFSPDIVDGAALTFGTGCTCQQNGAGGFVGTAKTHSTGDTYELQGDASAAYSTALGFTMLVEGVATYTFTVTTRAETVAEASIADRYTNTDHYTNMAHYV